MNESITMNAEGISNVLHTIFLGGKRLRELRFQLSAGEKA